jgi:hypothetical protein
VFFTNSWIIPKGRARYDRLLFKKRRFSAVNFSKKEDHFDPGPSPLKNMNIILAVCTYFRG